MGDPVDPASPMELELEIQRASDASNLPEDAEFRRWALAALNGRRQVAEMTIRIVDAQESRTLNRDYRGKDRPTNVLSFPYDAPAVAGIPLLGDLVICASVVESEAQDQAKSTQAHWAHMVVHGVLHLLGFDHIDEAEAQQMEALEREILAALGFPDPYAEDQ